MVALSDRGQDKRFMGELAIVHVLDGLSNSSRNFRVEPVQFSLPSLRKTAINPDRMRSAL